MKFGRSRRLASPLQKLALALRDGGVCAQPGCNTPWTKCDADHDPPWDENGRTDIAWMRNMCTCEHHPHRHETGSNISRQTDGTWTVDGETFPTWPPSTPIAPPPTTPPTRQPRRPPFGRTLRVGALGRSSGDRAHQLSRHVARATLEESGENW